MDDATTATQAADDAQASQTAAASSASNAATSETNAAAMFGVFNYAPPHNPYFGQVTATFWYI